MFLLSQAGILVDCFKYLALSWLFQLTRLLSSFSTSTTITLPNLLRFWPWPRSINPHFDECKGAAAAWTESFKAFSPEGQEAFKKCNFNLRAALGYPLLNKEGYRIGCDLMNFFFIIDEHSDHADSDTARAQAEIIMDVIRNPHKSRPDDEWVGGKAARSFWLNVMKSATPGAQKRLIDTFQAYVDAVVQQAIDRNDNNIRDIESFMKVRTLTGGVKLSFVILEVHMNLPDEVHRHPVIMKLNQLSADLIVINNDILSFKSEHERGEDDRNLITIVMHQMNMDIQSAMNFVGKMHDERAMQFLEEWKKLPKFGGPLDREVRTYCDGLGNWVSANIHWSYEGGRYFGNNRFRALEKFKSELDLSPPLSHRKMATLHYEGGNP